MLQLQHSSRCLSHSKLALTHEFSTGLSSEYPSPSLSLKRHTLQGSSGLWSQSFLLLAFSYGGSCKAAGEIVVSDTFSKIDSYFYSDHHI